MITPKHIIDFWFVEHGPANWFASDPQFDEKIRQRFLTTHRSAAAGELWKWRQTPQGRLAEVIVLDQFSRNLFRQDERAFACDAMALVLAQAAVALGVDDDLSAAEKSVFYLPFMHSESLAIHQQALKLFAGLGDANTLEYEKRHLEIIAEFGRYPHRNQVMGRTSTPQEIAFLEQPGSSF